MGGVLTWTLDEGPVEAFIRRAEALVQQHVPLPEPLPGSGPGASGPHWPPVGALGADALAGVGGVTAPAALGPLQAVGASPQAGAVLSCEEVSSV